FGARHVPALCHSAQRRRLSDSCRPRVIFCPSVWLTFRHASLPSVALRAGGACRAVAASAASVSRRRVAFARLCGNRKPALRETFFARNQSGGLFCQFAPNEKD